MDIISKDLIAIIAMSWSVISMTLVTGYLFYLNVRDAKRSEELDQRTEALAAKTREALQSNAIL